MATILWCALATACDSQVLETVKASSCEAMNAGEAARPSGAFLDSLGINAELDRLNDQEAAFTFARMRELGMRHVRAGAWQLMGIAPSVLKMLDDEGIKLLAQLSLTSDADALLAAHRTRLMGVQIPSASNDVVAPYEVALLPPFAMKLRATMQASTAGRDLTIVGPVLTSREDVTEVGDLSPWIDFGGFRSTIGNVKPNATFGSWADMAMTTSGGKPLIAVKAGWTGAGSVSTAAALSERQQARYVVRLLLESFNRGVVRTYYNQFDDGECSDAERCFSGLRQSDGTPKLAYLWWKSLAAALTANAAQVATQRLAWSVDAPQDVHHTLLEDALGDLWLVLWLEVDGSDAQDVQRRVTLSLPSSVRDVTRIDLGSAAAAPLTALNGSLAIPVSDVPLMLRVRTCR